MNTPEKQNPPQAQEDPKGHTLISPSRLTTKIKAAINKALGAQVDYQVATRADEATTEGGEPQANPMLGDLDPAFIDWYRRHKTAKEFAEKYRERLKFLQPENI